MTTGFAVCLAILMAGPTTVTKKTDLGDLAVADWSAVSKYRLSLLASRDTSITTLVTAVERDDVVPLTGTADLIYPGAKEFYGHGYVVPYDLDHVGDRAGWILEEVAFREFGFRSSVVFAHEAPDVAASRRKLAREAVRKWASGDGPKESCAAAMKRALGEGTPVEQGLAYAWIRGNGLPCPGFGAAMFHSELEPFVKAHAADPKHPMQHQAELLLRDVDGLHTR